MKRLLILLSFTFIAISCDEKTPEPEIVDFKSVKVTWTGDYQIDGCGYFVEIDSVRYKPRNEDFFGTDFQTANDTILEMRYLDLNQEITSQCGEGYPFKIRGIEIIDIR